MIRNTSSALWGAVTFFGLTMGPLLAAPASATLKLPTALEDQIRNACEASSADLAGKRGERRCRAELRERIERLSIGNERRIRLVVR